MEFFGAQFPISDEEGSRANFDDILWGFVTVFQVLTGEDWNNVLYKAMAVNAPVAVFYFVTLVIIGNFMVLNLYVID